MKKPASLFFIIFTLCSIHTYAQFSRYIIQFNNKAANPFLTTKPAQFLTQRSIDRRIKYNIAVDESDLPVTPAYVDSILLSGNVTLINISKWLNQVCIQTTDTAVLTKINSFSFVKKTAAVAARNSNPIWLFNKLSDPIPQSPGFFANDARPQSPADYYNYGQAYNQVHLNNTEFLHNHGFRGQGVQLAIMDAGFYHYESLPTFDSVRTNHQVIGTWDFVANEASVNEDFVHGMSCFSTIAANIPGTFVGTAPAASFYLYRTEDISSEYPVEEQNFAAAAERADSLGADIFSVSLGYTTFTNSAFNYTYSNMDGNTTIAARAADFAAKKGIFVTVAAGNDGTNNWHYISTPADADSVLTVGAVDVNRQVAGFSSFGSSADGQIKPDVAAVGSGAVIANQNSGLPALGYGTSFSCPVMAGVAACLWQAFPEVNNMAIIDALRKSSDRYTTPDNRTGFGIPDAKKAFVQLIQKLYTQQISITNSCKTDIRFSVKTATEMSIEIQRKLPAENNFKTISTQNTNTVFAPVNFAITDDLNGIKGNIAIQYRIKMNVAADTSFYLDSATVNYTNNCSGSNDKITIGPNPVKDNLSVTIKGDGNFTAAIEIYSAGGQKVYSMLNRKINNGETFLIPMKKMNADIYFVAVFIDNKKIVTKRIVLR
jgi:serine protease AprX